jgi:hypothetical protein
MNDKPFPLPLGRLGDVGNVIEDLFFHNPYFLRNINGVHWPFTQARNDSLPDGLHLSSLKKEELLF